MRDMPRIAITLEAERRDDGDLDGRHVRINHAHAAPRKQQCARSLGRGQNTTTALSTAISIRTSPESLSLVRLDLRLTLTLPSSG